MPLAAPGLGYYWPGDGLVNAAPYVRPLYRWTHTMRFALPFLLVMLYG